MATHAEDWVSIAEQAGPAREDYVDGNSQFSPVERRQQFFFPVWDLGRLVVGWP